VIDPESIRHAARKTLLEVLRNHRGPEKTEKKVPYSEFFPVDLKYVITTVLGWKLRPLRDYDQQAKSDFAQKVIFLNLTGTNQGEMNFSLAHEIGHALLHQRVVECNCGSLNRPPRSVRRRLRAFLPPEMVELETDANQFAAELLMPAKPVRAHFARLFQSASLASDSTQTQLHTGFGAGASVYDVAAALADKTPVRGLVSLTGQFGTSRSAMARRLVHLRLVHK
jgi:Zn-dependent peptidase ImmA (M78 family)